MPAHPEPDDESLADRAAESEAPLAATRTASEPAVRQPAVRKPAVRAKTAGKPAASKPAASKPVAAKRTVSKPAAAKPSVSRPSVSKPADTQPITEAGVTKPLVSKPAARKPAARKPAVRKPAVRKPAVRKPTTAKSPAAAEPLNTKPTEVTALAENATDETMRPYATRDALVTTTTAKPLIPPIAPPRELIDKPALTTTPKTTPKPAAKTIPAPPAKPVTQPTPESAPIVRAPLVRAPIVIEARGLVKRFGHNVAVSNLDLSVRAGSFYGIVGPNGAGKTTTLSMITGLLRPAAGTVTVHGIDVWARPNEAKRMIGILPDRLRLFDRLTGAQLLYYAGTLRGLDNDTVRSRSADLVAAFGLEDALNRLVADYSAGMTKKIALACAMIHSPRVLVLDEPFESVDPVSAVNVTEILQKYVAAGGTVVLSSHGMDLIQRVCDHVAIIVQGRVLAAGTIDEVRGQKTLENRFVELAGGRKVAEGMEWLHNFSD